MKRSTTCWQILSTLVVTIVCSNAYAQAIQLSNKAFDDTPPLPISAPSRDAGSPAIALTPTRSATRGWAIKPEDLTLANVFTRWAKDAGYRVLWDARKNVMIDGTDNLSGSFEDAVTAVLQGPAVALGAYPLEVCFYANTPPLARITRKGEQDKECN